MADSGSPGLRRDVAARAGRRCEYCRMPEWALLAGCEVDHVISELFTSRTLLNKLAEKLREKFGIRPQDLPLLRGYEDASTVVNPKRLPKPVCRDADDDEVLATEDLLSRGWAESDLATGRRSDPGKLAIAARLRSETTLPIK